MIDPNECIEFIWENVTLFGKAKGELAQLEAFKSSLKALKMQQSTQTSIAAKEMDAYASDEYQTHCKGIGEATENVELLKWKLECAKMRWETWRTEQANARQVDKMLK